MARTMTGGGPEAYKLADRISSAWISFIKTGDPNCKELPEWAPYEPETGASMIFNNTCEVRNNFDKSLLDLAATLPPTSRR